jgi:hypothetical protein
MSPELPINTQLLYEMQLRASYLVAQTVYVSYFEKLSSFNKFRNSVISLNIKEKSI